MSVFSQQPSKTFVSDQRIHDFGKILEKNGKVTHTFTFTNKGNTSVTIENVTAWCGCTTYKYTRTPIKPGKTGTVDITFNPNYRPGFFSKEVVVLTNGGKEYTRVWVKGNVIPYLHPVTEDYPYALGQGLYTGLKILAYSSIKKGESQSISLRYANDTNKPMTLTFVTEPHNENLVFINPGKIAAKARLKMLFTYTAPAEYSYNRYIKIYPVVNGKKLSQPLKATFLKSKD